MIYRYDSLNIPRNKVGGKAYNLSHLSKLDNICVPKWICLSIDLFYDFLSDNRKEYEDLLNNYEEQNRSKIIKIIEEKEFTEELKEKINGEIKNVFDKNTKLAVRSSAIDEDSVQFSFAGMLESYLNVENDDNIFEYIKKCYISCFSERIMQYRLKNNLVNSNISVAVIIQEMVEADYAGVIYTINPKTNNPDEVQISMVKGLGESLVSGQENSMDFVVDVFDNILKKDNNEIDEEIVKELSKKAHIIENSYKIKRPQDIEYAIKNNKIYILQCRIVANYNFIDKRKYRTILDNSNIIESYSGVTTPLTFTFAKDVYSKIYHQTLKNFFIKDDVINAIEDDLNNMLHFFENKIYYKLNSWYKMTLLYPGYEKNKGYMENMMGVKTPLKETSTQANNRLIKIYIRYIYKMLRMKKDSKIFLNKFNEVTKPYNNNKFEGKSNKELLKIYDDIEKQILNDFTTPIANDMGAMVFYGMLTDSLKKHKVEDYEGILSSILSKQGNVESVKQTTDLLEIVSIIKKDKVLMDKFLNNEIDLDSEEEIVKRLNEYILKFGSRSMEELKLETITMQEDSSFLFKTINNYLMIEENKNKRNITNETSDNEELEKERQVYKYYNFISRFYIKTLIKITKYFIRNRECLRLRRTYIYAIVRNIYLRIGKNLENDKIIDNYRDVFYLEKEEIIDIINGKSIKNIKELINKRKEEYLDNKDKETYERMYFYGEITRENMLPIYNEQEKNSNSNVLKGVAGGGKVVEGIVKYVEEPTDVDINGYILMAKRTDPGWTILFPMAKAIIIERGSVLSHSAVIAREMGITLVVGVRGLTEQIKDGTKVRVDGINGTIEILEE